MSDPREQRKYPGDQNKIAGHFGDGILSDGFKEFFGHVLGELTLEGTRIAATDHAPGDGDKSAGISGLGPEAQFGEGPHHGRFIEGRQGEHQFEETETEAFGQLLGKAEVEDHDLPSGRDKEVAGMGVRMKEAGGQDHADVDVHQILKDFGGGQARFFHAGLLGDLDPADEFHGEYSGCAPFAVDLGNLDMGVVGKEFPNPIRAIRLSNKVQFHAQMTSQFHEQGEKGEWLGVEEFVDATDPAHIPQVGTNDALDVGVLNFDRDLPAVDEPGPVDLGQGGRGKGRGLKFGEDRLDGLAELAFDHPPHLFKGFGGHCVVALLELLDELFRENVRARGHRLTELDHHAPKVESQIEDASGRPLMRGR